jgi:hypothetical protein
MKEYKKPELDLVLVGEIITASGMPGCQGENNTNTNCTTDGCSWDNLI